MSFALDLLTGGLELTPLSILTDGLLQGPLLFNAPGVPKSQVAIADVELGFDPERFTADLSVVAGDLAYERTLRTAVLLSLFLDRRATSEELERFGGDDSRGWWGDLVGLSEGDEFGSKLWLLERESATNETRNRAIEYTHESLQWLVDDGIADRADVEAEWMDRVDARFERGTLGIGIEIVKPTNPSERYAFIWQQA